MGGVLLPLSVLFPGFGLLVAAVGIAAQGTMTWQVWANPRSTWGQKGLSGDSVSRIGLARNKSVQELLRKWVV